MSVQFLGLVSVAGQLDREIQAEYELTIKANDVNSPAVATMKLIVIVEVCLITLIFGPVYNFIRFL